MPAKIRVAAIEVSHWHSLYDAAYLRLLAGMDDVQLVGLHDDYVLDGRVLIEALTTQATPQSLIAHRETLRRLGDIYEQVNAPFGEFGLSTLAASSNAIKSGSAADDSNYINVENQIGSLAGERDALAAQIRTALNAAAFDGAPLNEQQAKDWINQAQGLIDQAKQLAASS